MEPRGAQPGERKGMEHGKLELAGFESLLTWVMGGGGSVHGFWVWPGAG